MLFPALALAAFLIIPVSAEETRAPSSIGKVIGSEIRGNSTQLYLEVNRKLIPGSTVKLGNDLPAVVGELLSDRFKIFYYSATLAGKYKLAAGINVYPEGVVLPALVPRKISIWTKMKKSWSPYVSKREAEVTAVEGERALISRGSMHEVNVKDVYAIFDSSGHYRGKLELKGVGDFQSQGVLYNALEDLRKRSALQTAIGDRAVYLGQRKLFNLNVIFSQHYRKGKVLGRPETSIGGGLLWSITLRDGWGFEFIFGGFQRDGTGWFDSSYTTERIEDYVAWFVAPLWFRKNFFYPFFISPYLGVGTAFLMGEHEVHTTVNYQSQHFRVKTRRLVPMVGGGIEFFPGRFMHPRLEVRYFKGPKLVAGGSVYDTTSIFYAFALSTSW